MLFNHQADEALIVVESQAFSHLTLLLSFYLTPTFPLAPASLPQLTVDQAHFSSLGLSYLSPCTGSVILPEISQRIASCNERVGLCCRRFRLRRVRLRQHRSWWKTRSGAVMETEGNCQRGWVVEKGECGEGC